MNVLPLPVTPAPYVTRAQLAALMGVSTKTIQRWQRLGMPYETWGLRTCRYRPDQAMAWARARRYKAS